MSRYIFIRLFALFICIKLLNASFCGESSLPYYLRISPENELILGCAKPTCLNFLPGASSHFSSLEGNDGYYDGFKLPPKNSKNSFNITEKIECDEQFSATKCVKDGEWVGGIHPLRSSEVEITEDSETQQQLSFRCCRNSAMKKAKFQKLRPLWPSSFCKKITVEFKRGGDVYEKGKLIGFDYIGNIVIFENEQGITYEIFINRILCNKNNALSSDTTTTTATTTNATIQPAINLDQNNNIQRQKLYQALIEEAETPNTVNNADLQNINTEPQNAGAGANPTCSYAQIITNSGRGTDLPITQTGTQTVTVNCTAANPNAPIALNYFQQTADRGVTNGVGTVIQDLICNADGQLTIPPQPNLPNPVVVDQIECISPNPPPPPPLQNLQPPPIQQFQAPVQFIAQQPVFNPAAVAPVQYAAPATGFSFPGFSPSLDYLCFSGDTIVTTANGNKKRMDDLKINEWILSGDSRTGEIGYSKVISWIHKKPNLKAEFLAFTLENSQHLKITKKHYIFKGSCNSTTPTNLQMVYAEDVSIDDCLFTLDEHKELTETRISKIELIQEKGIYAPLTDTGNIIVNDIFASCYSNVNVKQMQKTFPSFTEKVKQILSFIGMHHLSSSSFSSSAFSNEYDLMPGFNLLFNVLKEVLPYKY